MPILINTKLPGTSSYGGLRGYVPTTPQSGVTPTLTQEQMDQLNTNIYNRTTGNNEGVSAWEHIARFSTGALVDVADSLWSTPINPWGARGDVTALVSPEQQAYMDRNKGAIEGTSAVVGGLGIAVAAETLIIPKLASALTGSAAAESSMLWRATAGWNQASRANMMTAMRGAAESGEAFSLFNNSAGRQFLLNRTVAGVANVTRTAPAEYALMWNNEAFNSGDLATEGYWMGAGIALGATLGSVGAGFAKRSAANSKEIMDLRSNPLNLSGARDDLLSGESLKLAGQIDINKVSLKESAYTTEYLLGSRAANPSRYDEAPANVARLNVMRDVLQSKAIDSTQKQINTGIEGVNTVKGSIKESPEAVHLVTETAKTDPFVFHGLAEVGLPTGPIKVMKEERAAHIETLEKQLKILNKQNAVQSAAKLGRKIRVMKEREDFIMVNGSWMDTDSPLAEAVAKHDAATAASKVVGITNTEGLKVVMPSVGEVHLDASLTPTYASGRKLNVAKMHPEDRLYLNEIANQMVKKLTRKDAKVNFVLNKDSAKSWYTLDLAAEVMSKGGKVDIDKKLTKIVSLDDIQRQSVRLKAQELLKEIGPLGRITPDLRFKYNLPMATSMESLEDSAGDGFTAWLHAAAGEKSTAKELSQALTDSRMIAGVDLLPPMGQPTARIDGAMLEFNRTKKGEWLRPMVGYFDPASQIGKISEKAHSSAMVLAKAERTALLMQNQTHIGRLSTMLAQMPETSLAMNVKGLSVDQLTGMGGGLGQAAGEILPNRFKWRDNPVILAASKLQEATERHGRAVFAELMEGVGMQKVVTQITSSGHAAQRASLDQYFSLRPGWDIDDVVPLSGGQYGFGLLDTPSNRKRLGMRETDEWTDALMPNSRLGKPIVVDDVGLAAIGAYNKLTDTLIDADNVLRSSQSLLPVKHKKFFAPVQETKGKIVGFVFGPDEKLVPGRTIVASTQEEYDKLTRRTLNEFGKGSGYSVKSKSALERLRTIDDKAQLDWIDPNVHSVEMTGSQKGGLTGAYVRQGAFNEALEWVQRKTTAQSQDALRQMMSEQILVAKASSLADQAVAGGEKAARNAYDIYEHALTGRGERFAETSMLDSSLKFVEKKLDAMLANSAIAAPARYITDLASRIGMHPGDLTGAKTFQQVADKMGSYTPFANVTELVESRGISMPPTIKGMSTKLNSLAASVFLRWLEVPHALMNGLGLIAATPGAVLSGRAPISTFVNVGNKAIGFVDGLKISANGMKRMFVKGSNGDWEHMLKNGDATQSVIEYHQQLGAIQSQAGFMKWAKNIDKWASIISETSESWSRQTAHFIGLEMADYHGIKGMEARHNFAREIANSMIADYAPINRSELFGSGFGSLVGLFQSYALNHYTKMFRWMETGDYAKAGLQAAVQATMFGVPGTYGIGALMDTRDSIVASGSEPTALDLIYEKFGPVLGGAIAHGGISELTGLALWSRGDMSPRIPGASGLPSLEVGLKVANGFTDGVKAFMNAQSGEGLYALSEVVQREMPNRILKSWLILGANDGQEIDAYGAVMTDTRNWMDTVARVVGVRSRRQQAELEGYYVGKGAMERDAVKKDRLRQNFAAAVRNNKDDPSAVNPIQYYNDYVEAGGNPRLFKTWVRDLLRDSNSARSVQALKGSMQTSKSALEVWRYGAYGAWSVNP